MKLLEDNIGGNLDDLRYGDDFLDKKSRHGTSLVAQWLRTRLPMQGTWVQALVQEDPICCRATKPVSHNY